MKPSDWITVFLAIRINFIGDVAEATTAKVMVKGGNFVDEQGRILMFRGFNSVVKRFPWYDPKMLDPLRLKQIKSMGFNVVRLGAMWTGVFPEDSSKPNETYVNILKDIVFKLGKHGIYTLLDMHQDVLWKAGRNDDLAGYWGIPPWVKHSLKHVDMNFPSPLNQVPQENWFCGYFTQEVGAGFQAIYDNQEGVADKMGEFWKFMVTNFQRHQSVLGYELINEPWAGDIMSNPLLLLPGIAGQNNLAPFYNRLHEQIRSVNDEILIFWEPVTWGYVIHKNIIPKNLEVTVKIFFESLDQDDLKLILNQVCDGEELTFARLIMKLKRLSLTLLFKILEAIGSKPSDNEDSPSIFGPGFKNVPGGSEYLNRTVLSWHYYCWALGQNTQGSGKPYDPAKKNLCDVILGPNEFRAVQDYASELGGSATMLTEFGLCLPNRQKPGSQGTEECNFVLNEAEKHYQSWIYWDTSDGDVFWDSKGKLIPDVIFMFARPYPRVVSGKPLQLSFDVFSRTFKFQFLQSSQQLGLATEIVLPVVQYPERRFRLLTSKGLKCNLSTEEGNILLCYSNNTSDVSLLIISPILL